MTIEAQTLLAVGIPTVGAIVWLVRLEGKILMNEQRTNAIADDVQYIRERIDAALNGTTHLKKRATD